jgi:hypothetical protein
VSNGPASSTSSAVTEDEAWMLERRMDRLVPEPARAGPNARPWTRVSRGAVSMVALSPRSLHASIVGPPTSGAKNAFTV